MKGKFKKALCLLLATTMLTSSIQLTTWATELPTTNAEGNTELEPVLTTSTEEYSGPCGDNLTWTLVNGVLTISGEGEMEEYHSTGDIPWAAYCEEVFEVIIEEGVTSFSRMAFIYCYNLKEVQLPDSLTEIESMAFTYCDIPTITIPKNVTIIGQQALAGCHEINVVAENTAFSSADGVLFDKLGHRLVQYPTLKDSTTYIVPESVKNIGIYAFTGSSLRHILLPAKLENIDHGAFMGCINLESFVVDEGNENFHVDEYGALYQLTSWLGQYDEEADQWVDQYKPLYTLVKFPSASKLDQYTVPDDTSFIASYAFADSSLGEITVLGNGVHSFGNNSLGIYNNAFINCKNLKVVNLPDSIIDSNNYFEYGLFFGCSSLEKVRIPNGVTSIGFDTFEKCSSLSKVQIPATVTEIESGVFNKCDSLTDVYFTGTEEQWNQIVIDEYGNAPLFNATIHFNSTMPEDDETVVTGVSLNTVSHSMKPGETLTLTATISPETAVNKNVTWSSNNEAVATVQDGVVTAVAAGEAIITVTTEDGSFTATCNVTVTMEEVKVTGITLNATSHSMKVGDVFTLIANVAPIEATNKNVSWASNNPSVVTVADGVITAVSVGNAVITVTTEDGAFKATCGVTVEEVPITNKCGDKATWSLDEDGVLRINGSGAMYNYDSYDAPWNDNIRAITSIIVDRDITYIGNNAFAGTPTYAGCPNLKELHINSESLAIGVNAFSYCINLEVIYLQEATFSTIKDDAFDGCDRLLTIFYEHSEKTWSNWKDTIVGKGNEKLISATVYANMKSLSIKYQDDLENREKAATIKWGYSLFDEDARNIEDYDPASFAELVKISALLSKNTYDLSAEGYLQQTLKQFGAKDIEVMDSGVLDIGYPAHSISRVEFYQDSKWQDLIIVTLRGSTTVGDWVTDFAAWGYDFGNPYKEHPGFALAETIIKLEIKTYLLEHGIAADDSKILITGHSYGAAVANLLANSLKDTFNQSNIYAYTFASPNNIVVNSNAMIGSNIHNFRNPWDPVVNIPVALKSNERYTVFGQQHVFTLEEIGDGSEGADIFGNHNCTHYVNYALDLVEHQSIDSLPTRCVQIHCPVDVTAYDAHGNVVGRITDNQLDESSTTIMMYPVGDQKNIFINRCEDIQLSLVATDSGTMDVIITEYDMVTGNVSAVKKYSDVGLKKDKIFSTNVSEETLTKNIELIVVDPEGNRLAVVKEDGTEIDISSKEDADTTNPDVDDDDSVDKPSYVYDEDDTEEDYFDTILKKIKAAKSGDTIQVNVGSKNRIPVELINALKKKDNVTLIIRRNKGDNITLTSEMSFKETSLSYYLISYLETLEAESTSSLVPEKENPSTGAF